MIPKSENLQEITDIITNETSKRHFNYIMYAMFIDWLVRYIPYFVKYMELLVLGINGGMNEKDDIYNQVSKKFQEIKKLLDQI